MVKTCGLLTDFSEEVTGVGDAMIAKVFSEREGKFKVTTEFSVDDAKTAGLWGKAGPWKTHPKRMLKYKARAFNLRDNFPDILKGLHLQEEMVGEVEEPMEKPVCDVAGRHDRRKKVDSVEKKVYSTLKQCEFLDKRGIEAGGMSFEEAGILITKAIAEEKQSPPPKDPAESATSADFAGVGDQNTHLDKPVEVVEADLGATEEVPPQCTPKASDSAGIIDAELIADEANLMKNDKIKMFDNLMEAYEAAGGTDFTEWAAEALCRDEDEVDSPEKFDADMIGRLERHLASEGV
jgi:hypothetical protein